MDAIQRFSAEETFTKGESPPSRAVVQAVADAEETGPVEIPPLYEAIDLEMLNRCLHEYGFDSVTFTYNGYEVVVESKGRVVLYE